MPAPTPLLRAYLDALPAGIGSYPDHVQKATVFRLFTQGKPLEPLLEVLPEETHDLVRHPPPVNVWIPEVHATCVYLAMAERTFSGPEALVEHAYQANREILSSAFYRTLLKLISPRRILSSSTSLWSQMHRGISLGFELVERGCLVRLGFPEHLVPDPLVPCYGTAFRAALELSGEKNVRGEIDASSSTEAVYRLRWD